MLSRNQTKGEEETMSGVSNRKERKKNGPSRVCILVIFRERKKERKKAVVWGEKQNDNERKAREFVCEGRERRGGKVIKHERERGLCLSFRFVAWRF